jgi:hypothetical protein
MQVAIKVIRRYTAQGDDQSKWPVCVIAIVQTLQSDVYSFGGACIVCDDHNFVDAYGTQEQ